MEEAQAERERKMEEAHAERERRPRLHLPTFASA
jgi:hypothetical protein